MASIPPGGFAIDPRASPYFIGGLGNGDGSGYYPWETLPGYESFMRPRDPAASSSGVDPQALYDYLTGRGLQLMESNAQGQLMRWVQDANGNVVGQAPTNYYTNDSAPIYAAMLGLGGIAGADALGLFGSAAPAEAAGAGIGTLPSQAIPAVASSGMAPLGAVGTVAPLPALGTMASMDTGLLSSLGGAAASGGASTMKKTTGPLAGLLGDAAPYASILAPLLGAYAGSQTSPGASETRTSRTDPRLDPFLYGPGGILQSATDWYSANKSGANDLMRQGWATQLGLLQDPAILASLTQFRNAAAQQMNAPVAGNPFTSGLLSLPRG